MRKRDQVRGRASGNMRCVYLRRLLNDQLMPHLTCCVAHGLCLSSSLAPLTQVRLTAALRSEFIVHLYALGDYE